MREALRPAVKLALRALSAAFAPVTAAAGAVWRAGVRLRFITDWTFPPTPDFFDHRFDIAFFERWRQPHFFERGVYASEICRGKRVLDLCSGDGAGAALFIAPVAASVLGLDQHPGAVAHARRRWQAIGNLRFEEMDIRKSELPQRAFEVILWDASIQYFTEQEMDSVLARAREALAAGGILHGSTIRGGSKKAQEQHRHEFASASELSELLRRHFSHVLIWTREHADRSSLYFRCSELPLQR